MNLTALRDQCRAAVRKSHGHVNRSPLVARCGGPAMCRHCLLELIAPMVEREVMEGAHDPALQPCPFCGGAARLSTRDIDAQITCNGCAATIEVKGLYKTDPKVTAAERAVDLWNRRA